jgi:hypothetical protein
MAGLLLKPLVVNISVTPHSKAYCPAQLTEKLSGALYCIELCVVHDSYQHK